MSLPPDYRKESWKGKLCNFIIIYSRVIRCTFYPSWRFWKIKSSCTVLFLIAILYHGFPCFRCFMLSAHPTSIHRVITLAFSLTNSSTRYAGRQTVDPLNQPKIEADKGSWTTLAREYVRFPAWHSIKRLIVSFPQFGISTSAATLQWRLWYILCYITVASLVYSLW